MSLHKFGSQSHKHQSSQNRTGRILLNSLAALLLIVISNVSTAQSVQNAPTPDIDGAEFTFTRLMYNDSGGRGYGNNNCGRGRWVTDCPEAEHFFMEGLTRLTRLDGHKVNMRSGEGTNFINLLRDDSIFDYPFLYAVEVGYWRFQPEEMAKLREYLLRGGFLIVDDFHGSEQWAGFLYTMQQILPGRPIIDIPQDDEVFHVLYDLDQKTQVPGRVSLMSGRTWEEDGYDPHWRGIYDDENRLVVVINHNMDLGDAWEEADTPGYPEPMTALAYRFAVNYVIYAMTH